MTNVFVTVDQVETPARFIDVRFNLMDNNEGRTQYEKEHVAGAVYFDLEKDLSDMSKQAGRHPMPEKEQLIELFEHVGLHLADRIYIYDQGGAPFAPRAWWMLKYAGFENVSIVNGGFEALKNAGYATTSNKESFDRSSITPNWQQDIYADREYVKAITEGAKEAILLDARAAIRYRGEHEPLDPVAGHIPTAKNFDWEQVKDGTHLVVTDELKQAVPTDQEVVVYCGSGVTASPLYTVLKEAGYDHVKLYVGSYSDWITKYPIATGEE
ncbi:sulfurtransferase [Lysinibacillus sp. KU-BSD001]|uniref:sulfurtransferase n=1 Tax=Lysinibacillus sp. KU-BSD001 TaxID=3141328 RepID=UPI0036E6F72B